MHTALSYILGALSSAYDNSEECRAIMSKPLPSVTLYDFFKLLQFANRPTRKYGEVVIKVGDLGEAAEEAGCRLDTSLLTRLQNCLRRGGYDIKTISDYDPEVGGGIFRVLDEGTGRFGEAYVDLGNISESEFRKIRNAGDGTVAALRSIAEAFDCKLLP